MEVGHPGAGLIRIEEAHELVDGDLHELVIVAGVPDLRVNELQSVVQVR